ncbi:MULTISPECIES: DUF502 domain-containing protein [Gammaproteobacteria]|uniref:DUF502 domain-containing protein n=1 Tax=Gammaproteobacteria TaxID=1236 RepID=UPI000DD0B438|nr:MULTISPECIES: DUF502 domain-containing protein [Gammaproteobacteria]RTE85950.1 DUF502 domain-containing protein [Aliidiomarina sp. B3213]TCZ90051.1 DUF502 domain-containing protein [Lysobacter sp. N42]
MKSFVSHILRGLAIVLPAILTLVVVVWFLTSLESWISSFLKPILGEKWYVPGLGIVSFVLICFVVGLSAEYKGIGWFWQLPGKLLLKIPGASQIYGMIQEVFEVMSGKNFADESVVLVKLPQSEVELIGIVTKKGGIKNDRMSSLMSEEHIAVFLPMAYNVGGYTVIVPKSCTTNVDMKPAEALQLVLTGGLGKGAGAKD